ncbi:MAG: protein BatD [Candidatus Schekmanbacteria bacterium]|nr:protein BatD [Candidatus Schekmanbacteria bacterium]
MAVARHLHFLVAGTLAMLCALPSPTIAATLTADLDRTAIGEGEQVVLTLTVEGVQSAPEPTFAGTRDFEISGAGSQSQYQVINGHVSASVEFRYLLVPKGKGTLTVPPASVTIDGETLTSKALHVTVADAPAAVGQAAQDRDAWIEQSVSPSVAFRGQQIVYTFRFITRAQFDDPQLELPPFTGFTVRELGEQQTGERVIDGRRHVVVTLTRALFPDRSGAIAIPAAKLKCNLVARSRRGRPFGGGIFDFGMSQAEPRLLRSEPLAVEVKELPAPPAGFTGLVGQFELTRKVSTARLHVGESATVAVTVQGTGNVDQISEPAMPEMTAFKVYADKPEMETAVRNGALWGARVYTKALVPLKEGARELAAMELVYFDPARQAYAFSRAPAVTLEVLPATGQESLNLTELQAAGQRKVAVKMLGEDILPIRKGLSALRPAIWSGRERLAALLGFALPPFAFAAALAVTRRRELLASDHRLRRHRLAAQVAREQLKGVRKKIAGGAANSDVLAEASRILRQFIGDRLGREGTALTSAEIAAVLRDAAVPPETGTAIVELVRRAEESRFAAGSAAADDAASIVAHVEQLTRKLERVTR